MKGGEYYVDIVHLFKLAFEMFILFGVMRPLRKISVEYVYRKYPIV